MAQPQERLATWLMWISVGAFAALWAARWPWFPLVLDPAYHLLVAQELVQAGGPFAYEWGQYAPVGRPHLYPPVLHLLIAGFLTCGWSPMTVVRLASVALPILLVASTALVVRRIAASQTALACVWMLLLPFAFSLHAAMALAATLGLIELLWLIAAVEGRKPIAAGLLFVLLVYTHLGLPIVALVMLALIAWWRADLRGTIAKAGAALVAAIPWWWHLWQHRGFLHAFSRQENAMVELMPAVAAMAAVGAWRCWRRRGIHAWWVALAGGFVIFAPMYPYRWLTGEGSLALALVGGAGLAWSAEALARRVRAASRPVSAMALVWLVFVATPTIARSTQGWQWSWPDSGPWHLIGPSAGSRAQEGLQGHIYAPPTQRLAATIASLTRPNEIVWANASYAAGLLAVLTGRATSSAMLDEIPPARPFDPIASAHLIVWLKMPPLPGMPEFSAVRQRYHLAPVAEDELATVFRNPLARQPAHPARAVISFGTAFVLLCVTIGVALWELSTQKVRIVHE